MSNDWFDDENVPEYFVQHVRSECSGTPGFIRVYNYGLRKGRKVLLFTGVLHAETLLKASRDIEQGALRAMDAETEFGDRHDN